MKLHRQDIKGCRDKEQGYNAAYRGAVRAGINPWALITLGSTPSNIQLAILLVESELTAIDTGNNRLLGPEMVAKRLKDIRD